MAKIPSDLRKNKETVIGNMDKREFLSVLLSIVFASLILYFLKMVLKVRGIIIPAFFSGLVVIPFLTYGYKKVKDMYIEDYLRVFINNKVYGSQDRENINYSIEKEVKNKKHEIFRIYRVKGENYKDTIEKMTKYLINKDILLLAKYVCYKDNKYIMYKINGKNLIEEKLINEKELKKDKEYRKNNNKSFDVLKSEIDIFDGYGENIKDLERIDILSYDRKTKEGTASGELQRNEMDRNNILINDMLKEDERKVYELDLYNINTIKDFIDSFSDRIIYIREDMMVDTFVYDNNKNIDIMKKEYIVEMIDIDKKSYIYESMVDTSCINMSNHYRKVNNIKDIL